MMLVARGARGGAGDRKGRADRPGQAILLRAPRGADGRGLIDRSPLGALVDAGC
jgi:hypothetical protein